MEPFGLLAGDTDSWSLATPPGHASHLVSLLTDDLVAKQSALEQLQRAVLKAEGCSLMRQWRLQEMEKSNGTLAADLSQLRKLLHEEKSSNKVLHHTYSTHLPSIVFACARHSIFPSPDGFVVAVFPIEAPH